MGLIDPGILFQQNPGALADGAKQTMGLMAGMQQMRGQREQRQNAQADRSRAEQAREAFAKSAQGEDITSPDGMKRTIAKFAQAGFPQEAAAVLDAHKEMFPPNGAPFPEPGRFSTKALGPPRPAGPTPSSRPRIRNGIRSGPPSWKRTSGTTVPWRQKRRLKPRKPRRQPARRS
jgi:hypothetical protein